MGHDALAPEETPRSRSPAGRTTFVTHEDHALQFHFVRNDDRVSNWGRAGGITMTEPKERPSVGSSGWP
jgi:hypothetical protein